MEKQIEHIVKTLDEFKIENKEGHQEIIKHQKETNGNVIRNTEFRLKTEGSISAMKWVLNFVGFGNIIIILGLVAVFFTK